jgi:hypothetical protein
VNPFLLDLSIGFGVLNLLVAGLVVANRFILRAQQRRYDLASERLKPIVLDWIDGETTEANTASRLERQVLADLLARYGRALTGEGRGHIVELADREELRADLLRATRSRSPWKRARAAFRLGDVGGDESARLIELVSDRDRRVRNAAVRSLGKQRSVEAVSTIVLALSSGSVARAVGGQALIEIGSAAAGGLASLLESSRPEVRSTAAELLGRLGSAEHAPRVAEHLSDHDATVRVAAVRALGRLGGRAASLAVPRLLEDQIAFVRAAAATALGNEGLANPLDFLEELHGFSADEVRSVMRDNCLELLGARQR